VRRISFLLFLAGLLLSTGTPAELRAQEERGKMIYLTGISPSGQNLTAVLGDQGAEIPAAVLPCVTCHGRDGRGRPEGGVTPSDLTWAALTKPYGATRLGGRQRPPYTEQRLKRAITMGFDAGGAPLDIAMPRYRFTHQDLDDLVAYLKKLGEEKDQGLTETSIRVGVILAPRALLAERNNAVRAVLMAYFDRVNQRGGLYSRQIDLRFSDAPETQQERLRAARAFIEEEQLFVILAPFIAGADKEMAALAAEQAIPFIGAYSVHPQVGFPLNRQVFYLYAGLIDQGRALVTFAARQQLAQDADARSPNVAILYTEQPGHEAVAIAIEDQGRREGWSSITWRRVASASFDAVALARDFQSNGIELVFWLGPPQQENAFLEAAEALSWTPTVFIPGALTGRELFEIPKRFSGRLFLSFPTLPLDQTPDGQRDYAQLAASYALPVHQQATQWAALASAKIFTEGLNRAGKDVSRDKLITVLEGFYEFQTGFTPPITYGPNRRVGALGAYIVTVDLEQRRLAPVSGWIVPR